MLQISALLDTMYYVTNFTLTSSSEEKMVLANKTVEGPISIEE